MARSRQSCPIRRCARCRHCSRVHECSTSPVASEAKRGRECAWLIGAQQPAAPSVAGQSRQGRDAAGRRWDAKQIEPLHTQRGHEKRRPFGGRTGVGPAGKDGKFAFLNLTRPRRSRRASGPAPLCVVADWRTPIRWMRDRHSLRACSTVSAVSLRRRSNRMAQRHLHSESLMSQRWKRSDEIAAPLWPVARGSMVRSDSGLVGCGRTAAWPSVSAVSGASAVQSDHEECECDSTHTDANPSIDVLRTDRDAGEGMSRVDPSRANRSSLM